MDSFVVLYMAELYTPRKNDVYTISYQLLNEIS